MASKAPRVFISYARDDDEPFVQRLYRDLTDKGIAVWWDRSTMESRGRTFLQELRDAIESCDWLIAVIGPKAVQSAYVRAEWEHAALFCKGLLPILRLGDYGLVPREILPEQALGMADQDFAKLHCINFRAMRPYEDALAELVRILGERLPPMAPLLTMVPALPPHFLPRRRQLEQLTDLVLEDARQPTVITSAKQVTGLQGMGGIGKSVLAAAFARSARARRAFSDGIVWITCGQTPNAAQLIRLLGEAFNDDPAPYIDLAPGAARLPQLLADKIALIVLDDIWDVKVAEPFFNGLGPRCRLLITTRLENVSAGLGARSVPLDVLSEAAALVLLGEWSHVEVANLPREAQELAAECGYLPLALAMIGAMLRDKPADRWTAALHRLKHADLERIKWQFPNYPYPDLLKAIEVSVDTLDLERERPRYLDLAVFPEDMAIPEAAIATLWAPLGVDLYDAQEMIDLFVARSLAQRDATNRLRLHDLQHDYVRKQTGDLLPLHRRLVEAYRGKCRQGWASGPNDGFYFENLPNHLAMVEDGGALRELLFDFRWMTAKLDVTGANPLIADYDLVLDDRVLRLVQGALRLAAHVLIRDTKQLAGQLLGRLLGNEEPEIREMLSHAWPSPCGRPWLRPLLASLMPPGGPLLRTLTGHNGDIYAIAVTPNGERAVSASFDNTLRVWDLASGRELHTLNLVFGFDVAVAIDPEGRFAVSSTNEDAGVKVWDLEGGMALRTLAVETGGPRPAPAYSAEFGPIAVATDGRRVFTASNDGVIRVWEIESGRELRNIPCISMPRDASGFLEEVAIAPEGRRVIFAGPDGTLKVWEMDTGRELLSLRAHDDDVMRVTITTDGRWAVSIGLDDLMKVWDLDTGRLMGSLPLPDLWLKTIALSLTPHWRRVVMVPVNDRRLKVWDLDSGRVYPMAGHSSTVETVTVTADGRLAISGAQDETLRVWNLEAGTGTPALTGHTRSIEALAITPDGRFAVSASADETLKVWDLEAGHGLSALSSNREYRPGFNRPMGWTRSWELTLVATEEGRRASFFSADGSLKVLDLDSMSEVRSLQHGHSSDPALLWKAISPDARLAVTAGEDAIKVWDLQVGRELRSLPNYFPDLDGLAVTPDGRCAVALSAGALIVWDLATGRELLTLPGCPNSVLTWALSQDGCQVIVLSNDAVKAWDLVSGCELRAFPGDAGWIQPVAVTPDCRLALITSSDATLEVWDLEAGCRLHVLHGHSERILSVAMTVCGRRAFSGSGDKTLKVWNLEQGALECTFSTDAQITHLALQPEGNKLCAGDWRGGIHLLALEEP